MKVVIDHAIPFIEGVIEPFAHVEYLAPESFTPSAIRDADALIIRTRTTVDKRLLEGSKVQFVGTATIGYDHIDTAYCEAHQIEWISCPGCNAQAVCDYIEEALSIITPKIATKPTIGVVGIGHVGSLVCQMAKKKGYTIFQNDPPKGIGISLDEIGEKCDIITFHTPLTKEGIYATYHLCDEAFLSRCKKGSFVINAARGGIVDEQALLSAINRRHIGGAIIDCWENEPDISSDLLLSPYLLGGSMHIAGYSLAGKWNATQMCLNAFSRHFGLNTLQARPISIQAGDSASGWLERITTTLKSQPKNFETLRKQYILR